MSGVIIAQTSTMTLLVMLQTGSDLESVVKDMCFVHRKQVAQAVKNVEKEKR
jgi:hypothetical protein